MSKRAIVFGVHPWGGPFQLGAHHLTRALARAGYETLYVAAPLSPPHLVGLASVRTRERWREVINPPSVQGVRVLAPFTWTPLSGRWGARDDRALADWPRHTMPPLDDVYRQTGFHRPDIALIDGPLQFAAASLAQPRRLVMRMFDRFAQMQGVTPALLRLAATAAQAADLVICSAFALEPDARALGARRVMVLPNGVDVAHFAAEQPEPSAYRTLARPRAIYVGQMGPLFDQHLLARVAVERPLIRFILIGPGNRAPALSALANVRFLGAAPWASLPAYLQHADVGLIPFATQQNRDYVDGINPLKLYEYLAAGVPTVSTRWPELDRIGAPGVALTEPAGFGAALDAMLAKRPSAEALRAFARINDWDTRLRQLLAALD